MPKQNRVNPFGELIATDARGKFMGNRGVLHDNNSQLTQKRWTHPHWIVCLTEFKDRKRPLMSPGCYTELFFTDEAVAMAAGHRPCAECRREGFNRFKAAWVEGNAHLDLPDKVGVSFIDNVLQKERVTRKREKVTYVDHAGNLPDGTFFALPDQPGTACLTWQGEFRIWTPEGYQAGEQLTKDMKVDVLTPASTVNAFRAGYVPKVRC